MQVDNDYVWVHMNMVKSGDTVSSHVGVCTCLYVLRKIIDFMPSNRKSSCLTYLAVLCRYYLGVVSFSSKHLSTIY
jgi:hypothetical protein